jgi:ABC-type Na+ efflux pump permease subunit
MMSFLRTTLLFWRTYLPRVLRARRTLIVALGFALLPLIAYVLLKVVSHGPSPIEAFLYPSFIMLLSVLVPLAAVITGSAVISEEVDDRTITYLLTRPISRASILVGRWLASATVLLMLTAGSVGALKVVVESQAPTWKKAEPRTVEWTNRRGEKRTRVIDRDIPQVFLDAMPEGKLPDGIFETMLIAAVLGSAVYSALFAALGTFNRHPMIVGLGYAFAIEGFLANLPGSSQSLTVQFYLRSLLVNENPELWKLVAEAQLQEPDPTRTALLTLAAILVGSLALGSLVISRRQFVLSA